VRLAKLFAFFVEVNLKYHSAKKKKKKVEEVVVAV
jgi:hypothetical protein